MSTSIADQPSSQPKGKQREAPRVPHLHRSTRTWLWSTGPFFPSTRFPTSFTIEGSFLVFCNRVLSSSICTRGQGVREADKGETAANAQRRLEGGSEQQQKHSPLGSNFVRRLQELLHPVPQVRADEGATSQVLLLRGYRRHQRCERRGGGKGKSALETSAHARR